MIVYNGLRETLLDRNWCVGELMMMSRMTLVYHGPRENADIEASIHHGLYAMLLFVFYVA